jgi:hypothetical protein
MVHRGGWEVFGKSKMCCIYQNRTPDLSARRINTVLSFIIIVITDFILTGLDLEILSLNAKRYQIMKQR